MPDSFYDPGYELFGRTRRGEFASSTLSGFLDTIAALNLQLAAIEKRLRAWHKSDAKSQRLAGAPGIGLIGATTLCVLVPDPSLFKNGRHLAAWLGLSPGSTGPEARRG